MTKTSRIEIRVSDENYERFKAAAALEHRSLSSWMLHHALEVADEVIMAVDKHEPVPTIEEALDRAAARQKDVEAKLPTRTSREALDDPMPKKPAPLLNWDQRSDAEREDYGRRLDVHYAELKLWRARNAQV